MNITLTKKLLYRSIHRGCKETDFLIGEFAKEKISSFDELELKLFSDFVVEDDMQIYDWILKKYEAPLKYQGLVKKICDFHKL